MMKKKVLTVLEKLHAIEKAKCIYDIHYCKAGVGVVFYYPEKDPCQTQPVIIGGKRIYDENVSWRQGLSVDAYYPTFEKTIEAEYKRLPSQHESQS